jgi:hypothetical protein
LRPPASTKEAAHRIEKLIGIAKSDTLDIPEKMDTMANH